MLNLKDPELYTLSPENHPRQFSQKLDQEIGYDIYNIESDLCQRVSKHKLKQQYSPGSQNWLGLDPQILQTPYPEIKEFLTVLKKYSPKKMVDFGAGYGRIGIVLQAIIPEASFVGYEIIKEPAQEANRIYKKYGLKDCQVYTEDLLSNNFVIPPADMYFIYDFCDPYGLRVLLNSLRKQFEKERVFMVARGKGVRSLIQNKYPEFWALNGVVHFDNWSLYASSVELSG